MIDAHGPIRVLVADDEAAVLDAYRRILEGVSDTTLSGDRTLDDLRATLFGGARPATTRPTFDLQVAYASSAEEAVSMTQAAHEAEQPFGLAFLDMRMPPGQDGIWAAQHIGAILRRSEDAALVAQRILDSVGQPVRVGEHEMMVTASIGIAVFPDDGEDPETLYRNADLAMYAAKRVGRNAFQFYTRGMNETAQKHLMVERLLRRALAEDELSLWFQPQLHLQSGEVTGMEALLRWASPELGTVPPLEFIPVAEETGLIIPIGEWVLRTACAQAKRWHDAGWFQLRMAVNVSVHQFVHPGYPDLVSRVLRDTGLCAEALELEITESVLMKDEAHAVETLSALKALGVSLALDDFGTGYSSLGLLRTFPIDRLKIDRSLIQVIGEGGDEKAIAAAVIAMAETMRLRVTAEGVETDGQLQYLRHNHCGDQGYVLSRPLQAEEAGAFLRSHHHRHQGSEGGDGPKSD